MLRNAPETVQAEPFTTLAEAQLVHVQLVGQARSLEERYGNALPQDDREIATDFERLRWQIRSFEWRLVSTGRRLSDQPQRGFAQSLLDFWALRQSDLKILADKFRGRSRASASRKPRPSSATGCVLLPYDEATAREAVDHAEAIYQALSEADREVARRAFSGLVLRSEQPPLEAEAALAAFVERGVLVRQTSETGEASYALGHEALVTAWPRLERWLAKARQEEADFERLKAGAEAWAQSGSSAELPRGEVIERAARYSTKDHSLADYVAAAQQQETFDRRVRWGVIGALVSFVALALVAIFYARLQGADIASDAVTHEVANLEEIIDVPATATATEDASASGLIGWIWVGSPDDPKVVGQDNESLTVDAIKRGMRIRTTSNLKVRDDRPKDGGANIAGRRQAGVSQGTLATALEDSAAIDVKGTEQYWLKVRLIPVVYIQLDKSSRVQLAGLRALLEHSGFQVPPAEGLPNIARPGASPPFNVRYYYQQDEPAARHVAELVARSLGSQSAGALTPLVDSALAERVKTGTIEVWLFQP